MQQRKIQLIAGSTYSVSLPKEWIVSNALKQKSLVSMKILDDKSLLVLAHESAENDKENTYSLAIDDFNEDIDQVLFALYYVGFEEITIFSKKEISHELKDVMKRAVEHMSGTEVVYEDTKKIQIKVLLDKTKIDIHQLFFRVGLLISSSFEVLKNGEKRTMRLNEHEIDRLYHLQAKVLTLASLQSSVLKSSGVQYSSRILPYFLIAKRLENIADSVYALRDINIVGEDLSQLLGILDQQLRRSMQYLAGEKKNLFTKTKKERVRALQEKINLLTNKNSQIHLRDILRYLVDIEEELVNVSFYKRLELG